MTAPPPAPGGPLLSTAWSSSGERCILTVSGDLDATAAPALGCCLLDVLARSGVREVELDLREVGFLDSAGLTALVVAHQAAQRTGQALCMRCGTNRAVLRPMGITGLSTVFTLVDE